MYVFEIDGDVFDVVYVIWAYRNNILGNIFSKSSVSGITYEVFDYLFLKSWVFFE